MSMTAKILCTVARPDEHIDVFMLVQRIEKAVNELVRAKAESLKLEGERLFSTMRRTELSRAETRICPLTGGARSLYTHFSMGPDNRRMLQILVNPADQAILPEQGTVLLSLGMGGEYREILAACGEALSGDTEFWYGDDSRDGFISGQALRSLLDSESTQVA